MKKIIKIYNFSKKKKKIIEIIRKRICPAIFDHSGMH